MCSLVVVAFSKIENIIEVKVVVVSGVGMIDHEFGVFPRHLLNILLK